MKRLLLSLLSLALLVGCASVPSPGIEPGKSITYTYTEREPVLTGSVLITVGKDVKWCHLKNQACIAEYTHPAVTSYMLLTTESYQLTPRKSGVIAYYHTDIGKTHAWDISSKKGVLGSCSVTLTKSGIERHYDEKCSLSGATITAKTVVGKNELLWMSGRASSPLRGVKEKDFTLSSARYSF